MHTTVCWAGDSTGHPHLTGSVMGEEFCAEQFLAAAGHGFGAGVSADEGSPKAFSPAGAKKPQKWHRHPDVNLRLLCSQNGIKLAVGAGSTKLQGFCSETRDGFRNQFTQTIRAGKRKADQYGVTGEDQFTQPGHVELYRVLQITIRIENALR